MQIERGDARSQPVVVMIEEFAPAVLIENGMQNGRGLIVHADDFRLVNEAAPARQGESVSIFCTGLGRVRPPVASGVVPVPGLPPPETVARPQVNVSGRAAVVTYSGLAPGWVGLYQVNFEVPEIPTDYGGWVELSVGGRYSNGVLMDLR